MSINASNDNLNEKVENFYDFETSMYCPYCLMPYNRPIQNEYTDIDPYDENFDYDFNLNIDTRAVENIEEDGIYVDFLFFHYSMTMTTGIGINNGECFKTS